MPNLANATATGLAEPLVPDFRQGEDINVAGAQEAPQTKARPLFCLWRHGPYLQKAYRPLQGISIQLEPVEMSHDTKLTHQPDPQFWAGW